MKTLSIEELARLPRPTARQREDFIHFVCGAHSWYKASLVHGVRFLVFVAPDAGEGYPEAQAWKFADYRGRFGHLDFMWCSPGAELWSREAGPRTRFAWEWRNAPRIPTGQGSAAFSPLGLPEVLCQECSFTLFPYCSTRRNALSFICDSWGSRALEHPLTRGEQALVPPELRRKILELEAELKATLGKPGASAMLAGDGTEELEKQIEHYRQLLTDCEQRGVDAASLHLLREQIDELVDGLAQGRKLLALYGALQSVEEQKIRDALANLERLVWPG